MRKMSGLLLILVFSALMIIGAAFPLEASGSGGGAGRAPTETEKKSDDLARNVDPSLVLANTGFAFDIFHTLVAEDPGQNVFISPLSILLALAMTYNGAAGDTSLAMAETLHFSRFQLEVLNQGFRDLMESVVNADREVETSIANSIWHPLGCDVEKGFIETNQTYYSSAVEELDFSNPKAADTINGWISDATRGKIREMIGRIPAGAVMYLINAIYFKGDWTHQFSEKKTRDGDFFLAGGAKKSVPMMHMEEELRYARANRCTVLRLPYGLEKLAMYILLPDRGTDLDAIISEMDEASWRWLRSELEEEDIALAMPRYKLEYEKTLNGALAGMGMGIAFGARADFSGIHPGFFISQVIHKAVIEVNEKGSEAAAVTAVVVDQSAPPERIEFIVDRPFFFAIADDRTGGILFMGKVAEP